MPRPNANSLSRLCHASTAAGSHSRRADVRPAPALGPMPAEQRQAADQGEHPGSGVLEDQGQDVRSGAAWSPCHVGSLVAKARRQHGSTAACAPPLPGARAMGALVCIGPWAPGAGLQPGVAPPNRSAGGISGGSLWLQGSPALTPEDSYAAIEGLPESSSRRTLHAEASSTSSVPLLSLSPQDSMVQLERRRKGRLQGPARSVRRALSCEERARPPQLACMIQHALRDPAGGSCVQSTCSTRSVQATPTTRPSGPERNSGVRIPAVYATESVVLMQMLNSVSSVAGRLNRARLASEQPASFRSGGRPISALACDRVLAAVSRDTGSCCIVHILRRILLFA